MRWGSLEMIGYGIILSIAAVAGGLLAGRLDEWIGPKLAVQLELVLLMVAQVLTLGMGRDRILFQPYHGEPLWQGALFTSAARSCLPRHRGVHGDLGHRRLRLVAHAC